MDMVCSGDASRTWLRAFVAVGAGLAVAVAAGSARAQTFPQDVQWVPLTCNGQVVTDAAGEVQPPAIDAVGDANNPAAYAFMDTRWLYLRLRMNASVHQDPSTYDPYAWACLIRTENTPGSYLVWDGVDGLANPTAVELLQNTHPQPGNPTQQPADAVVAAYNVTANAREVPAPSQFGGDADVFVDWAVALSDLDKVGITPSTPVTFICGSSRTEKVLDGDLIGDEQACGGGVLDPVTCAGASCASCTTANACGPSCNACNGRTSRCNPAFGCFAACTADADCGGSTPVCDTARGVCVGCTSDASCPAGTTCNLASGFCVGCRSNAGCPGGTFCDTASGTCTPCPQGAASCAGPGNAGGPVNVLAQGKIEGGSCACDAVGGDASSPAGLAALAVGLGVVLRGRSRPAKRRGTRTSHSPHSVKGDAVIR
jgi:MYXO-CTERM domain-containing protein